MAMAAMMPMIATTIKSSISEKPCWRFVFISYSCSLEKWLMFLAPTAFVITMFAAQSAKLSVDSLTRAVPLGRVAENAVNTGENGWVRRSLAGGPLITDKFRQAANDGFRQMTMLGMDSGTRTVSEGLFQIRGGAQLSGIWSLGSPVQCPGP